MYFRALLIEKRYLQWCPIVGDDPTIHSIQSPYDSSKLFVELANLNFACGVALDRIVVFRVNACTPAGGGL